MQIVHDPLVSLWNGSRGVGPLSDFAHTLLLRMAHTQLFHQAANQKHESSQVLFGQHLLETFFIQGTKDSLDTRT